MKLIYQKKDKRSYRAMRGGNWDGVTRRCRLAGRSRVSPGSRYDALGLRPARSKKVKERVKV